MLENSYTCKKNHVPLDAKIDRLSCYNNKTMCHWTIGKREYPVITAKDIMYLWAQRKRRLSCHDNKKILPENPQIILL